MRYAVIEAGSVVNVALWDGEAAWVLPPSQAAIPLPDGSPVGPGYTYSGGKFSPGPAPPPPLLDDYQKAARARIDADVDGVYLSVTGYRTTEYQAANSDATAFKAAGYTGTVPASVQCWATVKGWTAQQACDDILATAAGWIAAQQSMRANRLQKKQDVSNAASIAAVDALLSAWSNYMAAIRSQLAI